MSQHERAEAQRAVVDDEALARFIRHHEARVRRFARRTCRDGHDVDDAVQEAFVTLSQRDDVLRRPTALSWLFRVVRNGCLRLLRSVARQSPRRSDEDPLASVAAGTPDPARVLEQLELATRVHRAIARLEPSYREVLVYRDLEGLSGREVCRLLGLSSAAMKSRLHRARQQVRAELLAQGTDPPGRH
jgi:RNA polymerase sigma-70 factor (ECF subfamily)